MIGSSIGSALGAQIARFLPREVFTPIVLVALVVVGIYTWRRPELGLITERKHDGRKHYLITAGDRPGGGGVRRDPRSWDRDRSSSSCWWALLGWGFLEASAQAKIANLVTNLSAIAVFAAHGAVLWQLGLMMGAANLVGGFLGARTAISKGNSFVRKVFLVVVAALAVRLAYDTVRMLF